MFMYPYSSSQEMKGHVFQLQPNLIFLIITNSKYTVKSKSLTSAKTTGEIIYVMAHAYSKTRPRWKKRGFCQQIAIL